MNELTLKFRLKKSQGNYPGGEKDITYALYSDVPELIDKNDPDGLITVDRSKFAEKVGIKRFIELAEDKLDISDHKDMGYGESGRYIKDLETGIRIAEYRWGNIYLCLYIEMYTNKISEQERLERVYKKQNDYYKSFVKLYNIIKEYNASVPPPLYNETVLSREFKVKPTQDSNEFDKILAFGNYFKKSEVEFGTHGPELKDNALYISLYHYCQYKRFDPFDFDLFEFGNYLSGKTTDFIECKYTNQTYYIKKYNYDLIKEEDLNKFRSH